MIWTIIYKQIHTNKLKQVIVFGSHDHLDAIEESRCKVDGEILAVVAGSHDIHFNHLA